MAAKRIDHAREIAALAEVVRTAFGQLAAHGKTPSVPARAALEACDRWLAGEAVSTQALLACATAAWDHQRAVPLAARDPVITWSDTATGNLASLARKERGWQDGRRTILDAAAYAVSSLGVAAVWTRARFAALHARTYAKATAKVPAPAKAYEATRITARSAIAKALGVTAAGRLVKRRGEVRSDLRGDPAALAALLDARGFPSHACVLAFDARFGGLVFADEPGDASGDWYIGAFACLTLDTARSADGALVPVAFGPSDMVCYLDPEGVAWAEDEIEGERVRFADDGAAMLRALVKPPPRA